LKPLLLLDNKCLKNCPAGTLPDSSGFFCLAVSSNNGTGGNGTNNGTNNGGNGGTTVVDYGSPDEFIETDNTTSAYFTTQIA